MLDDAVAKISEIQKRIGHASAAMTSIYPQALRAINGSVARCRMIKVNVEITTNGGMVVNATIKPKLLIVILFLMSGGWVAPWVEPLARAIGWIS